MRRLSSLLFVLTLAAAPAAQPIDPCISLNQVCNGSRCYSEWTYHRLRIRNALHVELVPTANGVGMVCIFAGGPASDWMFSMIQLAPTAPLPPGCHQEVDMLVDAYWWLDLGATEGDWVTRCGQPIAPTHIEGVGFRLWNGPLACSSPHIYSPDLRVMREGNFTRKPLYWAALIRPARGYW